MDDTWLDWFKVMMEEDNNQHHFFFFKSTRGYTVNVAKGMIVYGVNMLRLMSLNEN